ncbi:hypothetical protein [Moraxella sp. ZY210820]|uniref:AbiTii domain-containing protein n=2 Tax=unclassified Moraxella TaxID=2685852 RepID=UPI00351F192E
MGDINIHENFLDCTIIPLPLARLESLLRNSEKFLDCTYIDPKIEEILRHYIDESFRQHIEKTGDFFLIDKNTKEIVRYMTNYIIVIQIQRNQILDIFSEVRQYILNWALSLEKAGILGENLIFTKEEQKMSANVTYNIQSVGNMANHNQHSTIQQLSSPVQKGDFNSLESALKSHGISTEDIQQLKEILDNVQQPVNELPAEVDGWLGKIGRTVKDISIQTIVGLITGYALG